MTNPTSIPDDLYDYHQEAQHLGHAAAYGSADIQPMIEVVRRCRATAYPQRGHNALMAGPALRRQALDLARARAVRTRSAEACRQYGMLIEINSAGA